MDPRITKMAEVLVNTSLKFKKGEKVLILAGIEAKPLVLELYRIFIKKGASLVRVNFDSYEFSEIFFKEASEEQILSFPKLSLVEIKAMDCFIAIKAATNIRALSNIDPKLISQRQQVLRPITDYRVEKTRWVVANYPTEAQAQEADMSLNSYSNFVYSAVNKVDWKKLQKRQEVIKRHLDKTDIVHILAPGTNLNFSVKGRKSVNAAGECNMPDGEVFTSVVENSTNGIITYSFPAIFMGREFEEVRLIFKNGKVIRTEAKKGKEDLDKILATDPGARRIGELGLGNNYQIKSFSKDILFDEKIGGTIHLALGKGFSETLSKNKSALHWDMICDLRIKGELWFDKKLVQKNGKWLI